jgi:hypothetical protein
VGLLRRPNAGQPGRRSRRTRQDARRSAL